MAVLSPATVYATGRKPPKSEIIQLLEQIMGSSSAPAVVKETKAALDLVTPASETYGGLVLNDPDPTKNGYYYRDSAAWVKGRGFPDTFAVVTSIGGTANAITASTEAGVNPADVLCVLLPDPPGTNSSTTVTLTLNGGSAESVKAASGANLAIGDIIEGVGTLFFKVGSEWRQLFSSATGATFDHQGDYAGGTTYTESQVVTGSDGKWYQLKDPSATGDDPVGSGTGAWLEILAAAAVADGAVTTAKLADGAVTEPKHATGGVSTRALADGSATLVKIGDDAKADFRRVGPGLGEPLNIVWYDENTVSFPRVSEIAMCGHFHQGRWEKATARIVAAPAAALGGCKALASVGDGISTQDDLLYENWASVDNWYNLWAVADDEDDILDYKFTPSLRAGSVAGSVVTLNEAGLGSFPSSPSAKTYQWSDDALIGVRVLVVTETIDSIENTWSGRIATITDNTNGTIALDTIGGVDVGDFLILLPNTDHFCWLADGYWEDNSINSPPDPLVSLKNIGTTGAFERQGYIIDLANQWPAAAASHPSTPGVKVSYAGDVSPLARSMIATSYVTLALASSGDYAEYFDQDGGDHVTNSIYCFKSQTSVAQTYVNPRLAIAGAYGPYFYFRNGGSQVANVTGHSLSVAGWVY